MSDNGFAVIERQLEETLATLKSTRDTQTEK
jgi:hypothetical protein